MLRLINVDFLPPDVDPDQILETMISKWEDLRIEYSSGGQMPFSPSTTSLVGYNDFHLKSSPAASMLFWSHLSTLLRRSILSYSRNILGYGIRLGMYSKYGVFNSWSYYVIDISSLYLILSVAIQYTIIIYNFGLISWNGYHASNCLAKVASGAVKSK